MEILRFASPSRRGEMKPPLKPNNKSSMFWGGEKAADAGGSSAIMSFAVVTREQYGGGRYDEFNDLSSNSTLPPFEDKESSSTSSAQYNNNNHDGSSNKRYNSPWVGGQAFPRSHGRAQQQQQQQPSRPALSKTLSQPQLSRHPMQNPIQFSPRQLEQKQQQQEEEEEEETEGKEEEQQEAQEPKNKTQTSLEKMLKSSNRRLDDTDEGNGSPKENWDTQSIQSAPAVKRNSRLANGSEPHGVPLGAPGAAGSGRPTLQKSISLRSLAVPRRAPRRSFSHSVATARIHAGIINRPPSLNHHLLDENTHNAASSLTQTLRGVRQRRASVSDASTTTGISASEMLSKRKTKSDHSRDRRKYLTRTPGRRRLSPKHDDNPKSRRGRDGGRIGASSLPQSSSSSSSSPRKASSNSGDVCGSRTALPPRKVTVRPSLCPRKRHSPVRAGTNLSKNRNSPPKEQRRLVISSPPRDRVKPDTTERKLKVFQDVCCSPIKLPAHQQHRTIATHSSGTEADLGSKSEEAKSNPPPPPAQPQAAQKHHQQQKSPWSTKKELIMSKPLPRTKEEFDSFFNALAANPIIMIS